MPVIALNVIGVSSFVVTLSATMSATGRKVSAMFLVVLSWPSPTMNCSKPLPLKSATGANDALNSAFCTSDCVPLKVIVALPRPLPTEKVRPVREASVVVPLVAISVTVRFGLSTSLTNRKLPPLNGTFVSSNMTTVVGAIDVGASLTGSTLMVIVALSVTPPDVTV